MCFYRPLNETNEWGLWPLREVQGRGAEKQLPRVSPEAPSQCRVSSGGDLGMGLGVSTSRGCVSEEGSLWGQRWS